MRKTWQVLPSLMLFTLPSPLMCLMAKCMISNSNGSESKSDDELTSNYLMNLLDEFTAIIMKQKGKIKSLETQNETLELNHSALLAKHNQVLSKVCQTRNLRANTLSYLLSTMT